MKIRFYISVLALASLTVVGVQASAPNVYVNPETFQTELNQLDALLNGGSLSPEQQKKWDAWLTKHRRYSSMKIDYMRKKFNDKIAGSRAATPAATPAAAAPAAPAAPASVAMVDPLQALKKDASDQFASFQDLQGNVAAKLGIVDAYSKNSVGNMPVTSVEEKFKKIYMIANIAEYVRLIISDEVKHLGGKDLLEVFIPFLNASNRLGENAEGLTQLQEQQLNGLLSDANRVKTLTENLINIYNRTIAEPPPAFKD